MVKSVALIACILAVGTSAMADEPAVENLRKRLASMDGVAICLGMGNAVRDKRLEPRLQLEWEQAARKYGALGAGFIPAIQRRQVQIGMHECDVLASLGRPNRINASHFPRAEHHQLVYAAPRRYVYTEDSIVTSWQD